VRATEMHTEFSAILEQSVLGKTPGRILLSTKEQHREAAAQLVSQANRRISLFTYDLDAPVYDQSPFLDAIKRLAIQSPHSKISILLQDNQRVQRNGHRLIRLMRQLPSRIELRRPHPDYIEHPENFLLVDGVGYIQRELYTRYEGIIDFYAPLEVRRLEEFFSEVWEQSEPDSELRRLSL